MAREEATTKKKLVVVCKKAKKKALKRPKPGLPNLGLPTSTSTRGEALTPPQQDEFGSLSIDTADYNEAMMLVESLIVDPASRIALPLPAETSDAEVFGVLECQLYDRLDIEDREGSCVSHDIARLLTQNRLRKLASQPSAVHGVAVLLRTSDYVRAVWSATRHHDGRTEVVEWWLTRVIPTMTSERVTEDHVEACWQKHPMPERVGAILTELQRIQVLLPCSVASASRALYQLWLPNWGTVLKAWHVASTKLLAHLKRSRYGERSLSSCLQPHSPIPTRLVVDWLASQDKVRVVTRPAGKFVQIVKQEAT